MLGGSRRSRLTRPSPVRRQKKHPAVMYTSPALGARSSMAFGGAKRKIRSHSRSTSKVTTRSCSKTQKKKDPITIVLSRLLRVLVGEAVCGLRSALAPFGRLPRSGPRRVRSSSRRSTPTPLAGRSAVGFEDANEKNQFVLGHAKPFTKPRRRLGLTVLQSRRRGAVPVRKSTG